jgi:hypothetical protein
MRAKGKSAKADQNNIICSFKNVDDQSNVVIITGEG